MLVPSKTIAIIPTKITSLEFIKVTPFANIVRYPLLCLEIPYLYVILMVCHSVKETVKPILLLVINLWHEDLKVEKNHTLGYLLYTKYKSVQTNNNKNKLIYIVL